MNWTHIKRQVPARVGRGDLAIISGSREFTLISGHPTRGAPCLVCREAIGGDPAMVVGLAALDGEACSCGTVVSDVYLVHSAHLPLTDALFITAISGALACATDHPDR